MTALTARARLSSFDRLSSLRVNRGGVPHGRMVHHHPGVERNVCGRCLRRASRFLEEDLRQELPVLRLAGGEAGETQEGLRSLQDSPVDRLQVKVAQRTSQPSNYQGSQDDYLRKQHQQVLRLPGGGGVVRGWTLPFTLSLERQSVPRFHPTGWRWIGVFSFSSFRELRVKREGLVV